MFILFELFGICERLSAVEGKYITSSLSVALLVFILTNAKRLMRGLRLPLGSKGMKTESLIY